MSRAPAGIAARGVSRALQQTGDLRVCECSAFALCLIRPQLSLSVREHPVISTTTSIVYFVMLLAHPKPEHPDYGSTDGAYAACWVDTLDAVIAESRARSLIEQVGWDAEELEECYPVAREHYESDPEALARYEQALQDGVVITLHRWAVGTDDEE